MKRILFSLLALAVFTTGALAGGMVHNTNQSAAWIRMLARDASTSVDAVFFNPAGTTKLADGFHLQLNTQTIGQTRTVTSNYAAFNNPKFEGTTFVPVLPTFFAVYKTGKFAVSAGFIVVGGGGGAEFPNGLPSFEAPIAGIPAQLTAQGIPTSKYSSEIAFNGTSTYFGYQANVAYAINDMVSVALGGRYVTASNAYEGSIKNIMINPNYPAFGADYNGTKLVSAPKFFTDASTFLTGVSTQMASTATSLGALVSGGGGGLTLAQAQGAGFLTATQVAGIQQLLGAAGLTAAQIGGATVAMSQGVLTTAAPVFATNSAQMAYYAGATADQEVDSKQTGTTFTPIFSVNVSLLEDKLNLAMKYEMASEMEVTNETAKDAQNMFPDGEKTNSDIPAFFSFGAAYKAMDNLSVQFGTHYYFDKSVSYGKTLFGEKNVKNDKVLDENSYEVATGLEYGINDQLKLSAGYLFTYSGPKSVYHSDMSYSMLTHTVGLGGAYQFNDAFALELGFLNTFYMEREFGYFSGSTMLPYTSVGDKTAWVLSFGFSYSFLQ